MTNDLTTTPTAPRSEARGLLITGAVLVVLGILGIAAVGSTAKELADTQVGASKSAPTTITAPLEGATTYAIYEAAEADKDGKNYVEAAGAVRRASWSS